MNRPSLLSKIDPRRQSRWLLGIAMVLIAPPNWAGNTQSIGGTGGVHQYAYSCSKDGRIAGIKIAYSEVIDDISFFCRTILHDGTDGVVGGKIVAGGGGGWTKPTRRWETSRHEASAICPPNTYVTKLSGLEYQLGTAKGLSGITLHCAYADSRGLQRGGIVETIRVTAGNNGRGQPTGVKACPSNKIARKGFGRRGLFVDSLALHCVSGTAQAPFNPTPPTLVSPKSNKPDRFRYAGRNQPFTFDQVANDPGYSPASEICVSAVNGGSCLLRENFPRSGATRRNVSLTIPDTLEGITAQWSMKTCAATNCYGQESQAETFHVYPKPVLLRSPLSRAQSEHRTVQFSWDNNRAATAGYQLVIRAANARFVLDRDEPSKNRHFRGKALNVQIGSGASGQRVQIPADLGNDLRWTVYSCSEYSGLGRRCNPTADSERILRLNSSATKTTGKPTTLLKTSPPKKTSLTK